MRPVRLRDQTRQSDNNKRAAHQRLFFFGYPQSETALLPLFGTKAILQLCLRSRSSLRADAIRFRSFLWCLIFPRP
jgi:hypothetical protein